ncbi:uncharacterized protein RCC_01947 [Ramularia collo-cygni]|uniref:Uncharacterized protein n=1 Tax=Ramularia collo-cygni TaxID=112498 RepID=A0A2D3UY62_9PEZI|nr:uncharacterized protein RCC_01947 [Ramularia collo-cygni]CZT16106.1 uncharacterized protein RCC_01947 [Ramularia collo-cygni]
MFSTLFITPSSFPSVLATDPGTCATYCAFRDVMSTACDAEYSFVVQFSTNITTTDLALKICQGCCCRRLSQPRNAGTRSCKRNIARVLKEYLAILHDASPDSIESCGYFRIDMERGSLIIIISPRIGRSGQLACAPLRLPEDDLPVLPIVVALVVFRTALNMSFTRGMRWNSHSNKFWLGVILALSALYFLLRHIGPALQHNLFEYQPLLPQRLDIARLTSPYSSTSRLTTNLVIASVKSDDISWTSRLQGLIPNLRIIRYVSNDQTAQYHPARPKAREALMYLTYLQDFYHDLADINIFIHADERSWHMDATLRKSLTFALTQLDLAQVVERGYFNLRTWAGDNPEHDCPNGFNTSKTALDSPKGEERLMAPVFLANFPGEDLPEILAGPCCSQFAVSKAAVLSRPIEQYQRSAQYLIDSPWPDQPVGRPWERLWPYLFQKRAIDCNSEWRTLCRMYGVCFPGQEEGHQRYESLWKEKDQLEEKIGLWREIWSPRMIRKDRSRLRDVEHELEEMLLQALSHGLDMAVRQEAGRAVD